MHDVICFSHVRWGCSYERPHHLMRRAARDRRVWFVEEPVFGAAAPRLQRSVTPDGVAVCVPHLPDGLPPLATAQALAALLEQLVMVEGIDAPLAWLYTPMMLPMVDAVGPRAVVYDCMDALWAAHFVSPELLLREHALLAASTLVFTSGRRLYEARRRSHPHVHLFPSSADTSHFAQARTPGVPEPEALRGLPSPRLCWSGDIDERLNLSLLAEVARRRPMWSWVMIGPTSGVDPRALPRSPNLHWFGPREYAELPAHLAHVDLGILPLARIDGARSDGTRQHAPQDSAPTRTAEYLAAGLPVVSTIAADGEDSFGEPDLVYRGDDAATFVSACERAMAERADPERQRRVDRFLGARSWDTTWAEMDRLIRGLAEDPASALRSATQSTR
jgi:glycosyltransferase involved in cell wall biosynthesis